MGGIPTVEHVDSLEEELGGRVVADCACAIDASEDWQSLWREQEALQGSQSN